MRLVTLGNCAHNDADTQLQSGKIAIDADAARASFATRAPVRGLTIKGSGATIKGGGRRAARRTRSCQSWALLRDTPIEMNSAPKSALAATNAHTRGAKS